VACVTETPRRSSNLRSCSCEPTSFAAIKSRITAWRWGFLVILCPLCAHAPVDSGRLYYYAFTVNKIPVGILGASGYVGRELCALIRGHPSLTLAFATANEQ